MSAPIQVRPDGTVLRIYPFAADLVRALNAPEASDAD